MNILDGNSYSFAIKFTGQLGELRYDSSNWDLLLHDGTTLGGHRFLNQTNADERYQARSAELDGLTEFEPQQKGFLVRLGPAIYRIRKLTVNTEEFELTEANGYNGNPYITLLETIGTTHTWAETQTFSKAIQAEGGVKGDIVGDVTGDVTGNLTGDSSGKHTGAVDARGSEVLFDDGAIPLATLGQDVLDYIAQAGIRPGCILIWSGFANEVPATFQLCDGTNGTPNLIDKFVIGAGGVYDVGASGGSTTSQADITILESGSHAHDVDVDDHVLTINEIPAHAHNSGVCDNGSYCFSRFTAAAPASGQSIDNSSTAGTFEAVTSQTGGGEGHGHTGSTQATGTHTHDVDVGDQEILPPYYALCFIMKMGA